MKRLLWLSVACIAIAPALSAQEKKAEEKKVAPKKEAPPLPKTTATIKYGDHERQVIDFWKAESDKPTPVLLYIHGGGWQAGDKNTVGTPRIKQCLDNGISVAAINYRYVKQAAEAGVSPPVKASLGDAARALQTIRSKAGEWNIDKKRIGATGGSAGGCSSLWLAFHDDMADPKSTDPVARESTRLYAAAVDGAQTTLDPVPLREWMPNYKYGSHAFNLASLDEVLKKREEIKKWIDEYSPMSHVSKDDPQIFLFYGLAKEDEPKPLKKGDTPKDPTHSGLLGMMLMEKLKEAGIDARLSVPAQPDPMYKNTTDYLVDRLKK